MRLLFALFGALFAGSASAADLGTFLDSAAAKSSAAGAKVASVPLEFSQLPPASTRCGLFGYKKAKSCKKAGDKTQSIADADSVFVFFGPPSMSTCSPFQIYNKCHGDKFCAEIPFTAFIQYDLEDDYLSVGINNINESFESCQASMATDLSDLATIHANAKACIYVGGKRKSRLKVVCEVTVVG